MRKLIITALMAATVLPAAAQAQATGELRRDRQNTRQEHRELDRARLSHDRHDVREERRDVRDARREFREDRADRDRRWGRDDWRGWRDHHRDIFARGDWRAPFRYYAFRPGVRVAPRYYGPRFVVADPWRYRLPPARWDQRWVRHYDDVILVDTRRGVAVDVIRGFYR